jgi:hemerythrin-like domain-containing protein
MSAHDSPTGLLRDQHQNILKVAAVLEHLLNDTPASLPMDYDSVGDCVRFIRLYADALHHGKEEDLLFPELLSLGMPKEGGPVAVMLYEHMLGRGYAKAMAEALPDARQGDAAAARRLADNGRSYIHLIREHIMKEDHVLFEMADQMIDGPACRRLCAAYDGVCSRTFDGCTVAELEAILGRLTARYPVGA